jgi:hypothetical protein
MKKIFLVAMFSLLAFVGLAIATYNITVYSEAEAAAELAKKDVPTITFGECKIISATKTVENNTEINSKPITIIGFAYYTKEGQNETRESVFATAARTTEIEAVFEAACKAKKAKLQDRFTTETKIVKIDYKNEIADTLAKVFDLATEKWK